VNDVRPYLQHAAAIVAPLRIARGVQNKVLEAMAMAKPVVATPAATRALAVVSGIHLWVEDAPLKFAGAVVAAVEGSDRFQVARSARNYVERHHNWARNLAALDDLLADRGNHGSTAGESDFIPNQASQNNFAPETSTENVASIGALP
jgi:glycosyltransferase involved in cell wall biosynthesis